jgi:hypothetical protein
LYEGTVQMENVDAGFQIAGRHVTHVQETELSREILHARVTDIISKIR